MRDYCTASENSLRTIDKEDRRCISEGKRSSQRIMKLFFETFARRTASYCRWDKRSTWALGKVRGCTLRRATRTVALHWLLRVKLTIIIKRRRSTIPPSFPPYSRHFIPEFSFSPLRPPGFSASRRRWWSHALCRTDLWPPSRLRPSKVNSNTLGCDQNSMDANRSGGARFECRARKLARGEKGGEAKIAETLPANVALSLAPHDPFSFVSFGSSRFYDTVNI